MDHNLKIVLILTVGFTLASLFGYLVQRIKLPTMLGFLVAGYMIGPHFPGYAADLQTAQQLAEVGVVLMLFSVGLHFKLENLFKVKKIAIPGAILQTSIATAVTVLFTGLTGWSVQSGIVLGLAIGVASTFVMARVLSDFNLLDTQEGHIAIGWLVVEDIFTVIVLALFPLIAIYNESSGGSYQSIITSILLVIGKLAILCLLVFTIGYRAIKFVLTRIARVRSQELFTLTILALVFLVASGSALIFGTSLALGAFIAGMVIGKTNVKHQAAANALSLRDTFTIVFFLSVGMLFNPFVIADHLGLFLGITAIILVVKPLVAFLFVIGFRLRVKAALAVSFSLAQIGEFSFILAEQATILKLLPEEAYDVIVVCALISIGLNPLLFRGLEGVEKLVRIIPFLSRVRKNTKDFRIEKSLKIRQKAIVVGYGPIGREVTKTLQEWEYSVAIIEHNIDTVSDHLSDVRIIYGDASFDQLLQEADVEHANLLVVTSPELQTTHRIIEFARRMNSKIKIVARVNHLSDVPGMQKMKVLHVCSERESCRAFIEAILQVRLEGI